MLAYTKSDPNSILSETRAPFIKIALNLRFPLFNPAIVPLLIM